MTYAGCVAAPARSPSVTSARRGRRGRVAGSSSSDGAGSSARAGRGRVAVGRSAAAGRRRRACSAMPLGRVVGVERQVGGAGLEHAAARRPVRGARQQHARRALRARRRGRRRCAGQPVGPARPARRRSGSRRRRSDRAARPASRAACAANSSGSGRRGQSRAGVVPLDQQPLPLGRGEQVERRRAGCPGRRPPRPAGATSRSASASTVAAVEQVGGVLERSRQPAGAPSAPSCSREVTVRSNLAAPVGDRRPRSARQAGQLDGRGRRCSAASA